MPNTRTYRLFDRFYEYCWKCCSLQLFIVCISLLKTISSEENSTLSFVIVLYRHGDRSPISTFPADKYQEDFWPQGFGQLSELGIQQEFQLGKYFRHRYVDSGLLNSTYKREEIYVRSTDMDRTLMSAQSVLAALYTPEGSQVWNDEIKWQPIPVHTTRMIDDTTLLRYGCEQLGVLRNAELASPEALAYTYQFNDTLAILNENSGTTFASYWDAGYLFDALFCEMQHNLTLPGWASPDLIKGFRQDAAVRRGLFMFRSEEERRLVGGPLVGEYLQRMDVFMKSLNKSLHVESPKMIMFSAHDSTIIKLLGTLGILGNKTVPYSTTVMVELRLLDRDPTQHIVQIWYRSHPDLPPVQLQLTGCALDCPYSQFTALLQPLVPEDIETDCQGSHLYLLGMDLSNILTVVLLAMGVGLVLLIFLLVCVVCCCARRCRRQRVRKYGRLRAEEIPEEVPMMNSFTTGSDFEE